MSDELFFLPIISEALRQAEPRGAMREAFERIRTMGQEPRYITGYQQFLRFMDSVNESLWTDAPEEVGAQLLDEMDRPTSIELVLERDDTPVARCSFGQPSGTRTIGSISPGQYRLKADTGLVLWEGSLTQQEVVWAKAFPDLDLPMAADMGDSKRQPTQEIDLLDGTLHVRIYPGLETGSLEITLEDPEAKK